VLFAEGSTGSNRKIALDDRAAKTGTGVSWRVSAQPGTAPAGKNTPIIGLRRTTRPGFSLSPLIALCKCYSLREDLKATKVAF